MSNPHPVALLLLACSLGAIAGSAHADFRQTADNATIGYEGPSGKAPVRCSTAAARRSKLSGIEGWVKVRDVTGALIWLERKALAERSNVQVKATVADVQAAPDAASPVVVPVPNRACCCSSSRHSRQCGRFGAGALSRWLPATCGSKRFSDSRPGRFSSRQPRSTGLLRGYPLP